MMNKIHHFCHAHAPSKKSYRTLLMGLGAILYVVHCVAPEHEIIMVLIIHGVVTLDPTT